MNPYYEEENITIYHGDCRDILPHLDPVDLVLTDPPYGINLEKQSLGGGGGVAPHKHKTLHKGTTWDRRPHNDTFCSFLNKSRNQIIWGGNYFASCLPDKMCWLVWDKVNGATDFADCELAWTSFDSAVRMFRFRWSGMLQQNMGMKEPRLHPTQKPIPLMRWCIERCDPAQTILDPFMGSGTTLVAAKQLGRKAVGIEIEERYCEIAVTRLQQGCFDLSTGLNQEGASSPEKPFPSSGDMRHTTQLSLIDNEHRTGT